MDQTDGSASVSVNMEDTASDKTDDQVTSDGDKTETKADMRVVITINQTETDDSKPDKAGGAGEEQADSLTGSDNTESGDSVGSQDPGQVNRAFVEDETEQSNAKVGRRKGHQRSPSYSPNKDDESITAVGGGGSEEMINPPILSDVTESHKEKEIYSEYFMPVNAYKPQIGEYKKNKAGPSAAKIFCWMFSLFLLAGAIVLAVLIGTGIIDTDSNRTVKVSRKLEPETSVGLIQVQKTATVDLIEVKKTDLPNVRTNLPAFFTSKTRHFTGELRLDNLDWTGDLAERHSYQFQQLARMVEDGMDELLTNQFENFTFETTVTKFSEGSVIVVFTIDVSSKLETDGFLDKSDIANAIKNNINQEYGFLFGKFSAPNDSVIIQGSQAEDNQDKQTEINMQSVAVVSMRTTTEVILTAKHSNQPASSILDVKSTSVSQISDDSENMEHLEISAEPKIDSIKENETGQDLDAEFTFQQELLETVTEYAETVTDLTYEFKSLELESEELGSGETEDATERVQALELN